MQINIVSWTTVHPIFRIMNLWSLAEKFICNNIGWFYYYFFDGLKKILEVWVYKMVLITSYFVHYSRLKTSKKISIILKSQYLQEVFYLHQLAAGQWHDDLFQAWNCGDVEDVWMEQLGRLWWSGYCWIFGVGKVGQSRWQERTLKKKWAGISMG